MQTMKTEFLVYRYGDKYFWTTYHLGAVAHGPFDSEQSAKEDADRYIKETIDRILQR